MRARLPVLLLLGGSSAFAQVGAPIATATALESQQKELDHYRTLAHDFGTLERYASANASLPPAIAGEQRVVFFGDSITDWWHLDQFFAGKPYVNRGISGQTTPQMLVRYFQDVLGLHPAAVLILAGTNDLAGNTGPETMEQIEADYGAFGELAKAQGIKVIFASVTPVSSYGKAGQAMLTGRPPERILALNRYLKDLCNTSGYTYLDYHTAMADSSGMLKKELSADGLHPNAAGYAVMAPLAERAIKQTLAR